MLGTGKEVPEKENKSNIYRIPPGQHSSRPRKKNFLGKTAKAETHRGQIYANHAWKLTKQGENKGGH